MKLLFVTAETFPTFRPDVAVLFGKYLPKLGLWTDLVAVRDPAMVGEMKWGGGQAYLWNAKAAGAKLRLGAFINGVIRMTAATGGKYDAIQIRDLPLLAAFGIFLAKIKGLKVIYWMSFPIPDGHRVLAIERGLSAGLIKFLFAWLNWKVGGFLLYRFVLKHVDHAFVQSESMVCELEKKGVDRRTLTPVPMGVDLERLTSIGTTDRREIIDAVRDRRVLVYLGALDRPRGIELMFDMLSYIMRTIPNVTLLLIGDTKDTAHREWLKSYASEVGVSENIIWTGWVETSEAWKMAKLAEIGLSPIPRGPLLDVSSPTKLIEYMALGLPVVCNDSPEQQQIVEYTNAGICVPYTPQHFSDAVLKILLEGGKSFGYDQRVVADFVRKQRSYDGIAAEVAQRYRRIIGK